MTEITTEATTASNRPASSSLASDSPASNHPVSPAGLLPHVIVTLLAPLFLAESGGDIQFARIAAMETVNAYRASDNVDLIAVAQVIACGLTALGSLGLSMTDDISLSMLLRLRGNAVALNRSAEQNRRALRESRPEFARPPQAEAMNTASEPDGEFREASVAAGVTALRKHATGTQAKAPASTPTPPQPYAHAPAPIPTQAATSSIPAAERQRQVVWGSAAATVAAEYTASLPHLLPAERKRVTVRAAALSSAANDLLAGITPARPRPGDLTGHMRPDPGSTPTLVRYAQP